MGIFKRADSPFWWYWLEGTTITASTKIPHTGRTPKATKDLRADAEAVYNAEMGDLARGKHKLPTRRSQRRRFDDHLDWYLENVTPTKAGAEREADLSKPLRDFFATYELGQIDRQLVTEYMTERRKTRVPIYLQHGRRKLSEHTVKASTINREVDLLKSIVKSAVPKFLEHSPIEGMPRLKTTPVRRRTMTHDEEDRLLAELAADDKALVLMGLDCLVRLGDCLDVRREDVRGHTLEIIDPKSGDSYRVHMSSRLRGALDEIPVDAIDPEHYFARRRRAKTQLARVHAVMQMLRQACQRAKIPYGRRNGITFHWGTRRTGLSRMLQSNEVSLATAQKVGNWKRPDVVLQVYAEVITDHERAAVEVVGRRSDKTGAA